MQWDKKTIHRNAKMFFCIVLLSYCWIFVSPSARATEYTSSSFKVLDPVLYPSGYSTSSGYSLTSTIAQIAIGTSTAGAGIPREDRSGFLYFSFANSPTLSATPGDGEVALSWTPSVGVLGWTVSGYDLGRATVSGGPYIYTDVGLLLATTTTGLANGTTYYFVVRVRDAFGNSIASSSQVAATPFAPGGGGGVGSGTPYPGESDIGTVAYSGKAYPGAIVDVLRDGIISESVLSDTNGDFSGSVALPSGTYQLGFSAKDALGRHSNLLGRSISVMEGATTTLAGLFLSPTIAVESEEIEKDGSVGVLGYAYPGSLVTLTVSQDATLSANVYVSQLPAGADGRYAYRFFADTYPAGRYIARARAASGGETSTLSEPAYFTIIAGEEKKTPGKTCRPGDLNDDGSVDLVDFSIATYWYKRALKSPFQEREASCLNGDGKVDIYDFSLMAYYWTG